MDRSLLLNTYLIVVGAGGLLVVARVYIGLYRNRLSRIRRLASRRRFEAIPTETPVDEPAALARNRAVESIDHQFTVNRLIFVPLVLFLTLLALVLPFLDQAPATVVSVMVAVITVLVGMAARPFLENAIAGLVISSSRLVNLGDTVLIDDLYGTVEDITATHTTIKVWDWRRLVVPNSTMLQSSFLNYSLHDRYVWAAVDLWVAYETDIDRVRELAVRHAKQSAGYMGGEDPEFWLRDMTPQGIRCTVAAWAASPTDAWTLKHNVRLGLARSFRAEGLRAMVQHLDMRSAGSGDGDEARRKVAPAEGEGQVYAVAGSGSVDLDPVPVLAGAHGEGGPPGELFGNLRG